MQRKILSFAVLMALSFGVANFSQDSALKKEKIGKIYAGLSYVQAKSGGSAEEGLVLGVWGVAHSAISGAAYGAVFGGPAGAAVGIGIGL